MSGLLFRDIPKIGKFKISFELKKNALSDWLLELSTHNTRMACASLLQFLQAINQLDLTAKNRISFLKISHEYLKQYIKQLDSSCWEASLPLSVKEVDYAEAIVWNYLTLSEGFFIAAQDSGIKTEQLFALYMACYSLGQAQLHIAAVYKTPNEAFWRLTYQIFSWAEKYNLLRTQINKESLKNIMINDLFIQIFIFQSCETNQFSPHEMRIIFDFLPKVSSNCFIYQLLDIKFQTEILNIPYFQAILNKFHNLPENILEAIEDCNDLFVFDFHTATPPAIFNQTFSVAQTSLRYFITTPVTDKLRYILENGETWHGILKLINQKLFEHVIQIVEHKRRRRYARLQVEDRLLGVIGFENIVSFLYKVGRKSNVKMDPVLKSNLSSYEELKEYVNTTKIQQREIDGSLEEIEFVCPFENDNSIWSHKTEKNITDRLVSLKKLTVCDSSMRGYLIHWSNDENLKMKIGDLFGVISKDKKRLEIAIIRRIGVTSKEGFNLGIEVLGFSSELVVITFMEDESRGEWAIFIPGSKKLEQEDSIIYQIGSFCIGEFIYIHRHNKKISAVIIKEFNVISSITHAELRYSFSP
jgi:hypothetical protein